MIEVCSAENWAPIYTPPPKTSCFEIYQSGGGTPGDGIYTIAPPPFSDGFEVWCKMTGAYKGATLAVRKGDLNGSNCGSNVGYSNGARVQGCEKVTADRHVPCREDYRPS